MKKFLYIICFCFLSFNVRAETLVLSEELNFGKFVQVNGNTSTITIDANGLRTMVGAVNASSKPPQEGRLTFVVDNAQYTTEENKFILNPTSQGNLPHCSASIKNLTFNNQEAIINSETNSSVTTGVGATLELGGYCKEGYYTGSLVVDYEHVVSLDNTESSSNKMVLVPFAFEVEEPLSATVKKHMNFGSYISPKEDATIVLTPDGAIVRNISAVGTTQPHGATIEVEGVSNRSVSINFETEETLLTNDNNENPVSLRADNFTLYPGKTIRLPDMGETVSSKQEVFVGATLHVPQNTPPGEYKGNIIITFLYNYD